MVDEQKLIFSWQCGQCMMSTTKIASGKQQTKVTLTFLIVIRWFQVKRLQQCKTKKQGTKTLKLVMALYYEVQVLKTYGFGIRLSKVLSFFHCGFRACEQFLHISHTAAWQHTIVHPKRKLKDAMLFYGVTTPRHLSLIVLFTELLRFHKSC